MDLIEMVFASVVSRIVADDINAGLPGFLSRLVAKAASKLPLERRKQLEEEWLSHLDETEGTLSKLRTAWGFIRAARSIANYDKKSRNKVLHDARVQWLVSELSTQFIEELESGPEHRTVLELARRGITKDLLSAKYMPEFVTALMIIDRDYYRGADYQAMDKFRQSIRKAAKLVLDKGGKQYSICLRIGRFKLEISRFMGIFYLIFGHKG